MAILRNLWSISTASVAALWIASGADAGSCSPSSITNPSIPNGQVLDLSASPVNDYKFQNSTLDFCNVTITYTHPGWDDEIHVSIWLPSSGWNKRLQGAGGSGWSALENEEKMAKAVIVNYASVGTDAGHTIDDSQHSGSWSLNESGKVNMPLLKDFAHVALNDAAIIGKDVVRSYYGNGPQYSYWNGCSTGGRQGLMFAQRYPTAYDGILAGAPAINWAKFIVAEYWPNFVMNQLQTFPPECVTDEITAAAVQACDGIDGVKDGVISDPSRCEFDPLTMVHKKVNCNGQSVTITQNDTLVVQKTWEGMRSTDGSFLWYGLEKGAPLSGGLAGTKCSTPSNCTGIPFSIASDWISQFILENPSADLTRLSHEEYQQIFHDSIDRYNDIIGTDNPDLSAFKQAGGKMLTWHGLADELIFPKGTEHYYKAVEALDPSVRDFYRFFPAPGVHHCGDGNGPIPVDPLEPVVAWVEKGIAPETIFAKTADGARSRNLCPYPLVSVYKGGDNHDASSYACEESA